MANVENRAAEHGSVIQSGAGTIKATTGKLFVAIKILEDAEIASVVALGDTVGAETYYTAKAVAAGETILGNFHSITLTTGVIQAIYS
jgi:hypothetical protein